MVYSGWIDDYHNTVDIRADFLGNFQSSARHLLYITSLISYTYFTFFYTNWLSSNDRRLHYLAILYLEWHQRLSRVPRFAYMFGRIRFSDKVFIVLIKGSLAKNRIRNPVYLTLWRVRVSRHLKSVLKTKYVESALQRSRYLHVYTNCCVWFQIRVISQGGFFGHSALVIF